MHLITSPAIKSYQTNSVNIAVQQCMLVMLNNKATAIKRANKNFDSKYSLLYDLEMQKNKRKTNRQ